ncbi:MAG: polymorphic toxin-type HINT domain-containing protein [Candidatus Dormibacteria bacterium]
MPCESFSAGSQVVLASGATVAISQLWPGARVLATDPQTGMTQPETVAAVGINHDTDLMDVVVQTAKGQGTIDSTAHHLFWDVSTKAWTAADQLRTGNRLFTPNGQPATVSRLIGIPGAADMWDLTVANDHDFYVVTVDTAILVHNCDINSTASALQHIQDTHFEGGPDFDPATKGMFADGESPAQLVADADGTAPYTLQSGALARTVWAGRLVGFEQGTGQGTMVYTVITNAGGRLLTAYPGVP